MLSKNSLTTIIKVARICNQQQQYNDYTPFTLRNVTGFVKPFQITHLVFQENTKLKYCITMLLQQKYRVIL